ncbi:MAG: AtpZ/AtpI family protein [Lachnospiraceae bacterium]|nr:AtpZ/AtpI family protein [Lachnospiraceae bacterium]
MDKDTRRNLKIVFLITQIAIVMMVSMAIGGFLGYYIGKQLDADYIVLIGLGVGAGAGFNGVYDVVKGYLKNEQASKKKEMTDEEKKLAEAEAAFSEWRARRDEESNDGNR